MGGWSAASTAGSTRAAWDALPDEARYEAVPSEDGSFVTCDVPDPETPMLRPPADRPGPDLAGISVEGRICGDRVVDIFVTAADWVLIPADRRPPALRERTGRWYLAFEPLTRDNPTTIDGEAGHEG